MTEPVASPVKLRIAMTGKASAAKAATRDKPVFAYIASLPPLRGIAERIDALAATMPFAGGKKQ